MSKLLATLLALSLPALPAPQEPTFRSASSELVVLPVVVTDKRGGFVQDLPQDSFVVYDNGRRVPIELFTNEDTPVTVGLIIDASSSMAPKIGEVIAAALAFARFSNPNDELFAIRFNDDVLDVGGGGEETVRAGDPEALRHVLQSIRPEGRTALYDALMAGLDRLDRAGRSRKILILMSDGGDNASHATEAAVLQRARKSNASIYTIGLFDVMDADSNPRLLKSLARDTGGERFLPKSPGPLLTACERIAREIRAGYTIGYAPPARDGAFHRVRVELQAADTRRFEIRTRPGYFAAARLSQN
jgi:Ca-activated chloride channel homolog